MTKQRRRKKVKVGRRGACIVSDEGDWDLVTAEAQRPNPVCREEIEGGGGGGCNRLSFPCSIKKCCSLYIYFIHIVFCKFGLHISIACEGVYTYIPIHNSTAYQYHQIPASAIYTARMKERSAGPLLDRWSEEISTICPSPYDQLIPRP